ncbi:MAG: hypothetical protein K9I82_15760 [Chitinophagaceae bacterium]|jgi:hypothetical protein|nr:hypothetical protein [Chitinophagaceae bacterium]
MKFLFILLFPITVFAQTDCKTANVTYSLQLFSTKNVQLFDATHIEPTDTIVVEEVCVKGEKRFRIMIPQDSELFAKDAKLKYSKFWKDCFIVKYVDGKRYN